MGRSRKERVVSGLTAALLVVGVTAFLALDPAEDEQTTADREALDAACVAAKAQVVEAANALTEPDGAPRYASRIVIAMTDLRDAAAVSGITGVEALRRVAFDAAVAAGRVGRLSRETTSPAATQEALRQSVAALDALSGPTDELALTRCATTQISRDDG